MSNTDPIIVGVSDFNLYEGVRKLGESANVDVSPLAIVSFDFTFNRNRTTPRASAPETVAARAGPANIPPWTDSSPDLQSCSARILTLGRLDSVRFDTLSARIDTDSLPLLQAYAQALTRCAGIRLRISGLKGPGERGPAAAVLDVQRAQAVSRYLWSRGVQRSRMETGGQDTARDGTPPTGNGRVQFTIIN